MDAEACERKEYINVKHKGSCGEWIRIIDT